jgi:sugar/nucleoside kinase (ribokinase family)
MDTNNYFDVVVIGNAGIDTNIYMQGTEIDFSVEANFTENLDYVGQAGGYTSRGFAQLGWRTGFLGYLGADYHGEFIRRVFAHDGIDISTIFTDAAGTARSVNFMYQDGRRKNFYDGKSHLTLKPALDKCQKLLSKTRLAHFHIPNWARMLLPIATEAGIVISCDIQDVIELQDPYRQDFMDAADILFCSATNLEDPIAFARQRLVNKPDQVIIMGMGSDGCLSATQQGIWLHPAVDLDRAVIDTNGAGDGLAVGFLASYVLEQRSLHASVLFGQIAARHTCTIKASTDNLIRQAELHQWFAQLLPYDSPRRID